MRTYRRRRRRNLRCVELVIGPGELSGLIAKGYLAPGDRDNVGAIAGAIDGLMYDCLIYRG